jgi:hypothetical protein
VKEFPVLWKPMMAEDVNKTSIVCFDVKIAGTNVTTLKKVSWV